MHVQAPAGEDSAMCQVFLSFSLSISLSLFLSRTVSLYIYMDTSVYLYLFGSLSFGRNPEAPKPQRLVEIS